MSVRWFWVWFCRGILFLREGQTWSTRIVNPPADFVCKTWARGAFPRPCFRIEWNHSIEKESRKIKELERVLGEKVGHFFKTAALRCHRSRGRSFRPGA
jgi:hypothetical protein